eukprot:106124_1
MSTDASICNFDNTKKCHHTTHLLSFMKEYKYNLQEQKSDIVVDSTKICNLLDDYIHLLYQHDTDKEFQFVADNLPKCESSIQCNGYIRNYRNRRAVHRSVQETIYVQLLDKIHCYFVHSNDIGYRIFTQDEMKSPHNHTSNSLFIHNKLNNFKQQLLQIERRQSHRENSKTKQLLSIDNEQKIYNFGYPIIYKAHHNNLDDELDESPNYAAYVDPKYTTLKDELTQNHISKVFYLYSSLIMNIRKRQSILVHPFANRNFLKKHN